MRVTAIEVDKIYIGRRSGSIVLRKALELCPNQQMGTQIYYESLYGDSRGRGTKHYCSLKNFARWAGNRLKTWLKERDEEAKHPPEPGMTMARSPLEHPDSWLRKLAEAEED